MNFHESTRIRVMGGQKQTFVRFQSDLESGRIGPDDYDLSSDSFHQTSSSISSCVRRAWEKGSQGLKNIGQKKIFSPQDKFLQKWNMIFVISCLVAVSVDPLFLYLPVINDKLNCLDVDHNLATIATVFRTITDLFYLMHMVLQFRIAFIAPSSRVFGRGELIIDPIQIAKRYLSTYFIIDFLAVLPLPQVVIWIIIPIMRGKAALNTKNILWLIVLLQYLPRFIRIFPLYAHVIRTAGVLIETAWVRAAYNLILYMLASHVLGACWYLLALERQHTCWREACREYGTKCAIESLYCEKKQSIALTGEIKKKLHVYCNASNPNFDFGIYGPALESGIIATKRFLKKYIYCLWWGLRNLSSLGQNLETSTYVWEMSFAMFIAIIGLVLFALLIGNMQTYLQSLTVDYRLQEMRVKCRDTEQWMQHHLLPEGLRKRVRRDIQYKWLETRGVDQETLIHNLPKDIKREIKRHLCLESVRRVPFFSLMDDQLLDAMCERLKPSLYTEDTFILREGHPVDEMIFIIRGLLESVTTNGGRTDFFDRIQLEQGDFCGEELLTWVLDPKSSSDLPSSTRTVKALTEVEAFALRAEDLKFVTSQFRRLRSRKFQHTLRFYSQHWRTWAAIFIQAAWRRYNRRKTKDLRCKEEKRLQAAMLANNGNASSSLGATIYASGFATNALRLHRQRNIRLPERSISLIKLQKPTETDFSDQDP